MSAAISAVGLLNLIMALAGIATFVGLLFLGSRVVPGRRVRGVPMSSGERHTYTLNGLALFALAALLAALGQALGGWSIASLYDDEEITGLLLTALFAGQHTSAVLAAWVGIELLQHCEYLARVLAALETAYGRGEGLSLDTVKEQSVLERAVREGERLHPPLILLVRKVLRSFEYKEFHIPARSMAMVSPLLSHRLPTVFEDPERYDPDRFSPPREEHKRSTHALIGFGGGRHRCLGMHFAYMQLAVLWSVLLSRFEWDLISPPPAPDYGSWVTGPRAPCRVRYRRRSAPLGSRL